MARIDVKGAQIDAPTSSGAASNVSKATCMYVINVGSTVRLVTIQDDAGSPTTLGSFSIGAGASHFVEKNPTDEIFAAHADVKITPVAMVP
tara:strand:+ start:355 stop:627 length:273 start_codon:yes stop_codon:yes gene_type:complete